MRPGRRLRPAVAVVFAAAAAGVSAQAGPSLPEVTIQGHYDTAVGAFDAASAGVATATLIERRPTLRPAEVLEFVPGLVVTQHSGAGKANQYFLRGFNLDHGTDFATWVDGMPVNMPSHAHGQGYSDLNWLVPELVDRIGFRKGPYDAQDGDFSSAGSARLQLRDTLARPVAEVTGGTWRHARVLLAQSRALGRGQLLHALEGSHGDGPWQRPEQARRSNAVLRYSEADGPQRWSLTGMGYRAGWYATDQVPQRALAAGRVDRFGTLDPTDGGTTARSSLSWNWQRQVRDGQWQASAYTIRSRLDLYSNFTGWLLHPADLPGVDAAGVRGDQFAQSERRAVLGGAVSRRWDTAPGGRDGTTTLGLQVRRDRIDPVGLHATEARERVALIQESRVRQSSLGVHLANDTQWLPWLRAVAGVRGDRFDFDVASSLADNSGRRAASIVSPRLALVLGPWSATEVFVNAGTGFHSNDARGTVARLAPRERLPVEPVTPLVRSRGAELGLRTQVLRGLQSSLALWQLRLASELVFSGDAGDTAPSRASRRRGLEWDIHWRVVPWLQWDLAMAWSRARFTQPDPAGDAVPGAAGRVASLGATVSGPGAWSGHVQLRHVGPRPLVEDGSQRSSPSTLAQVRVAYRLTPQTQFRVDVFNLLNRKASDVEYFYASRLRGEAPGGVEDLHLHPVEPRSVRVTVSTTY
ncbi:TonB-dependent receptor [Ramlibacter sp. MAHUQ-53]|uniref:TonB-dependent receptor n=1 Tax=unclassified Ramlibacter TaxID=2617605 RepID=UPI0036366150